MHSYIFQLSTRPIEAEDYLSEDAAFEKAERYVCCVTEISDEKRAEVITSLVCKWLPSDLFEINGDGTFTYLGGYEKWVKNFLIPSIQEAAMTLMADKVSLTGMGSSFEVRKRIENPLDMSSLFLITENPNTPNVFTEPAKQSGDFMDDFIKYLEPGTRIYIGGIYDYHF